MNILEPGKGDLDKRTYCVINLYENNQFIHSKNDAPNMFLKMDDSIYPLARLLMDRRNNIFKNYNYRTIPSNLLEDILDMTQYIYKEENQIKSLFTVQNPFEHWFK